MKKSLEINGRNYVFTGNRKALCALADMQNMDDKSELLDEMFYALLKPEHNLSREEISNLLDEAEEEYRVQDLLEFATQLINGGFDQAEKKYKTIEFLNRNKK